VLDMVVLLGCGGLSVFRDERSSLPTSK
jgi:hypothetical protein